jgi:hypothetical protein
MPLNFFIKYSPICSIEENRFSAEADYQTGKADICAARHWRAGRKFVKQLRLKGRTTMLS